MLLILRKSLMEGVASLVKSDIANAITCAQENAIQMTEITIHHAHSPVLKDALLTSTGANVCAQKNVVGVENK